MPRTSLYRSTVGRAFGLWRSPRRGLPILGLGGLLGHLDAQRALTNQAGPDRGKREIARCTTRSTGDLRLLDDEHRLLLCRLSVFRRSAALSRNRGRVRRSDLRRPTLELVADLCDHNLQITIPGSGFPRFRLLETVREFASAQLTDEQARATVKRHRAWYAEWAVRFGCAQRRTWLGDLAEGSASRRREPACSY